MNEEDDPISNPTSFIFFSKYTENKVAISDKS